MASPVKVVRIFLKILSTIAGIFFLCKSSFSQMQFGEDGNLKTFVTAVLSALVVTSIFVVPMLRREWIAEGQGNRMKLVVKSIFFVFITVLVFLIKFPRFNIHSEYSRSCVNEQREKMAPGSVFNLLSAAAFSFFSFIIASRREEAGVLGFSTILLGLTTDASIEINGTHGPNFLWIGVAASFCVALIFFGGYAESLRGNPGRPEDRNRFVQYTKVLELPSAIAAIISLSFCSFSKLQFQNSSNLEVACLSVFSLLLGAWMKNLPGWIDKIVQACSNPLRVAAQNSLLLLITSVLIFLNKFPRFNIHSKYREFCTEKEEKSINHGSRFDLYSLGAFAFLASLISSEQPYDERQSFESGIFSFLLDLVMDASIETLENKKPNIWYVMFAFMYCVGLIFLKACFPPDQQNNGTGGGGGGGGRGEDLDDDLEAQYRSVRGRDDRNDGRDADRNGGGYDDDRGEADGRGGDENERDGRTGGQSGVSSSYPQAEEDREIVQYDGGGRREEQGHDIGEIGLNIESRFAPRHETETMLPEDETSSSATALRRRIAATTFVVESLSQNLFAPPQPAQRRGGLIAPRVRRPAPQNLRARPPPEG